MLLTLALREIPSCSTCAEARAHTPILDRIKEYDVFGVHFNIADEENKRPNIDFLHGVKRDQYILLVSGYVRSWENVDELLGIGADLVGVARPTRENASFIELPMSKP